MTGRMVARLVAYVMAVGVWVVSSIHDEVRLHRRRFVCWRDGHRWVCMTDSHVCGACGEWSSANACDRCAGW